MMLSPPIISRFGKATERLCKTSAPTLQKFRGLPEKRQENTAPRVFPRVLRGNAGRLRLGSTAFVALPPGFESQHIETGVRVERLGRAGV